MRKFIFIIGLLLSFTSCVRGNIKVTTLENFNIRGFIFGVTRETIIKNEVALIMKEGNIFGTETLSYKVKLFGIDCTIQYLFPDGTLKNAWYDFKFEESNFVEIIKKYNYLIDELSKNYGIPHFNGFREALYSDAKVINKKITDKNIKSDLENEKCVYIVEWTFANQVEIQLVIRGQEKSGLKYYLNYNAPDYTF
ncbi:MAG: hypothetical protein JXR70_15715 [Spirochaetales bacterium]|nr:hypothetical protein [Spirochaetales bacterium]